MNMIFPLSHSTWRGQLQLTLNLPRAYIRYRCPRLKILIKYVLIVRVIDLLVGFIYLTDITLWKWLISFGSCSFDWL